MLENTNVQFIKLKRGEDLIAFLIEETEHTVRIKRPLVVRVENDFIGGRQLIEVKEWLPQLMIEIEEITLNKTDLLLITPIRAAFKAKFMSFINDFYELERDKKEPPQDNVNNSADSDDKIIPFFNRNHSEKLN